MKWLLLLIVLNLILGPVVVRVPLIDWTFDSTASTATAGWTLWPFVVALDSGAWGDRVREHEMRHWRHPLWSEEKVDSLDLPGEGE